MALEEPVLVAFTSGGEELHAGFIERFARVAPELELYVVSEFPVSKGHWIAYKPGRSAAENLERVQSEIAGKRIVWAALLLQPRRPYWQMKRMALKLARGRLLLFNENLDHFALHPRSAGAIVRHMWWRVSGAISYQTNPGGWIYTQVWRLFHPSALIRPLTYRMAVRAGMAAGVAKRATAPAADPPSVEMQEGISVVIPSRNGRILLERMLEEVFRQLQGTAHEVVVVDNGSDDGTAEWISREFPEAAVEVNAEPLSFAAAVNRGIARSRFSHVCLLNNDMEVSAGFFENLRAAFDMVPDLFCATAQIRFPEGKRREETGKAVLWPYCTPQEFPVRCLEPLAGEDLTPVTYGSGGCSMYDARKLRTVGGFGEEFTPAYVEDLDVCWRGWQRGWPTVLAAGAEVLHHHRATTGRYFSEAEIRLAVETNYLRFLARSVCDAGLFEELWAKAVLRLNWHAAQEPPPEWALPALRRALKVREWIGSQPADLKDERLAMNLSGGEVFCFPGRQSAASGRPVVVVASPYVPFPLSHGGAVRMFNLMKRAAAGFDQVLICFCDEAFTPAEELLEIAREVVLVQRQGTHLRPLTDRPEVVEEHDTMPFRAALRELVRRHGPSIIQLEFTQMALYAADCGGVPSVLVEHDITIDLYEQLAAQKDDWETRQQLTRWQTFERGAWRQVDCVVAMSEKDAATVEGARRVEVIANGVDLERFQPSEEEPEKRRVLFIGSFAHLPNLLALRFFLDEAWPALRAAGARLHVIAGANPERARNLHRGQVVVDLEDESIELEGFVSDVRPAYRRASVVVAPLLASAGTNIKIMEAMAMGKAIVSTPAGINGLDLRPGEDVVVVESGAEMAKEIEVLFNETERRKRIETEARRTGERQFDWDRIAERQAEIYRSLIRGA